MRLNKLSKSEQFAFASDLFFIQAIDNSLSNAGFFRKFTKNKFNLNYKFPSRCYKQIIGWLLNNGPQIGVAHFNATADFIENTFEYLVKFNNEREQDKMHRFFAMINTKRPNTVQNRIVSDGNQFPPMPDLYQGNSEVSQPMLMEYKNALYRVFNDESSEINIPTRNGFCNYVLNDD